MYLCSRMATMRSMKQYRDATYSCFTGQSFLLFSKDFVCIDVAICDQVHYVEIIFHLPELLTAFGNLFCNMNDSRCSVIMLICPCNVDPLTPHFCIVKSGLQGIPFSSHFCSKT